MSDSIVQAVSQIAKGSGHKDMAYKWFGLNEPPFAHTQDIKYYFRNLGAEKALSYLTERIRQNRHIGLLTGDPGTGKTLLLDLFAQNLSSRGVVVKIIKPPLKPLLFLAAIYDSLDINYSQDTLNTNLLSRRVRALSTRSLAGERRVFILIDDAQKLTPEVSQQLVELLKNEDGSPYVILFGRPEIYSLAEHGGLSELLGNQSNSYRLKPFSKKETCGYIEHRLKICGGCPQRFTATSINTVHRLSGGIPRNINTLCDISLNLAHQQSRPVVSAALVRSAAQSIPAWHAKRWYSRPILVPFGIDWESFSDRIHQVRESVFGGPRNELTVSSAAGARGHLSDARFMEEKGVTTGIYRNSVSVARLTQSKYDNPGSKRTPSSAASVQAGFVSTKTSPGQNNRHPANEPKDMVLIPGMQLGSAYSRQTINVAAFLLDRTPVTNREYRKFVEETGYKPPDYWFRSTPPSKLLDCPVVGVNFEDARRFARWCGKRLLTRFEWESAARRPKGRVFPWGHHWEPVKCNSPNSGPGKLTPVGAYTSGASVDGCLDLVGNAWEWTVDSEARDSAETGYSWVLGGSFRHPCMVDGAIPCSQVLKINKYSYLGFRCAVDPQ